VYVFTSIQSSSVYEIKGPGAPGKVHHIVFNPNPKTNPNLISNTIPNPNPACQNYDVVNFSGNAGTLNLKESPALNTDTLSGYIIYI